MKFSKLRIFLFVSVVSTAAYFMYAPCPAAEMKELSKTVLFENGYLARAYLTSDQKWRLPVDSEKLPKWMAPSLYCLEDKRFLQHSGVDVLAVARAVKQNFNAGKVVSGASTLTMQIARLSAPKERTLFSKTREALTALQIEARLTKTEILNLYLNEAPFGGNIEGIEAASYRFFRKSSAWLAPDEFAFLMTLPQTPGRWDKLTKPQLLQVRNQKLLKMKDCGLISEADFTKYTAAPVPEFRKSLDTYAAHWADDLAGQNQSMGIIHSTLNLEMQKAFEEAVRKKRLALNEKDIQNIGIVAIENATGKVKAAIGNFDYFEDGSAQKFAGYKVFRSTGSTLKPFFYASLISSGEMLPETLLEDVPYDFNGYSPKNYDGTFSGLVESQQALAHSLNMPFIKKLSEEGIDSLLNFLKAGGLTLNLPNKDIGLSMIIGGVQASLLDLTRIYSAFPNEGKLFPLQTIVSEQASQQGPAAHGLKDSSAKAFQWFHPGAAELTSRALGIRGRPDYSIDPAYFRDDLGLRWKTGTSQGRKDAWAIGYNKTYTIGVWLGNMNNDPAPALVGSEIAAPFLFDLFKIAYGDAYHDHPYSSHLQKVEVCSFSGQMPGPNCTHRKSVDAPRGISPRHRCQYHQEVLVDAKSGLRINQDCQLTGMNPQLKSYTVLPGDVQMWLSDTNSQLQLQPPFHPKCKWVSKEKGRLEIIEPRDDVYVITGIGSSKKELILPLKIRTPNRGETPNCFLNGEKVKMNKSDIQQLLTLKPGDYDLMCADKLGRSDQVEFRVEL